jgi:hypothetical protein
MKLSTLYTAVPSYIEVADVPANPSTAPQTITANTLTTLTLNTEVQDTDNIASLSSNRVTIPAGTYYYEAVAACGRTATATPPQAILGLWNNTASAWISRSESYFALSAGHESCYSSLSGQFVISVASDLELKILVRTESQMRMNGSNSPHTNTTAGATQRQTLKLWKLK